MSATIREINNRPMFWTDKTGVTHKCEGADVHKGIRLLWTLCEIDVPANSAFLPAGDDRVTCKVCGEKK